MKDLFNSDPIEYALDLIDQGRINENELLIACLKWMSYDQIREMLHENELSPELCAAFDEGYCTEEISKEEKYACEIYNEHYSYA